MANFAELDENNIVVNVLVVADDITTINGVENEQLGVDFLNDLFPDSGTWIQTSYNNNIRFNYAGIGHTYDAENDTFYEPQPYPSWTLDENFMWQPPNPMPDDDKSYEWNEETQAWDEIELDGE
jgi:hypothetical protein